MIDPERQTDKIFAEIDKQNNVTRTQVRGILTALDETYRITDLNQILDDEINGIRAKIVDIINILSEKQRNIGFVSFVAAAIERTKILEQKRVRLRTLPGIDYECTRLEALGEPESSKRRIATIILQCRTREQIARNEEPGEGFKGNELSLLKFLFVNLCKHRDWKKWITEFLKHRLFKLRAFQSLTNNTEREKLLEEYCLGENLNPHETLKNDYQSITNNDWDELRDKFIEIMLEQLRDFITFSKPSSPSPSSPEASRHTV